MSAVDDLLARITAKLDEDEIAARASRGIWPRPAVEDSGAVWLHIKRGGNAVVVRYDEPVAGYGDMADLRKWADTEDGWSADRVLREIASTRKLVAKIMAIEVWADEQEAMLRAVAERWEQ